MKRIALALHGGVVHMLGGASSQEEAPVYHVDDSQGQCMHESHLYGCHGNLYVYYPTFSVQCTVGCGTEEHGRLPGPPPGPREAVLQEAPVEVHGTTVP